MLRVDNDLLRFDMIRLDLLRFAKIYRKPFGGPADPVNDLDPIQTLFWPEGIGSEHS